MTKSFLKSWRSIASAVVVFAAANACGSGTISGGGDKVVAGLRFVSQPTGTSAAGTTFALSVELLDASGAKISNADDVVSLTVNGGANLLGNTSIAAVAGVASFPGLSVTRTGTGFTISATANGVTASSSSFTVTHAPANAGQSGATYTPSTITAGATIAVVFTFKDQYGNPIPNKTVTLSSNLAGVTFTPSTGSTSATGTFTTNMVATAAGSATVSASVDGVSISLPTAVTITAPVTFTIATSSNPAAGGTTTGGGTFNSGASVTVVATAATGFVFTNWTEGTTVASTSASFNFNATANRTLVANFTATSSGNCTPTALTFPGTASGTVSTTGCIANSVPSAYYRFTTTAASQSHTFSVASSFTTPVIQLLLDGGTSGTALIGTAGTSTTTAEWMLPAGTYQVRVANPTVANGTFTLTGTSTAANNTSCVQRWMVTTITMSQTVASSDCPYGDGTFYDLYSIATNQTCTFVMSSTQFQTYLAVRSSAAPSTDVTANQGSATFSVGSPSTATLGPGPCNMSGNALLLVANNFNVGQVGTYTLTVTIAGSSPPGAANLGSYSSPWFTVQETSPAAWGPVTSPLKKK